MIDYIETFSGVMIQTLLNWKQITLPKSFGGLGIQESKLTMHASWPNYNDSYSQTIINYGFLYLNISMVRLQEIGKMDLMF